MEPVSQKARKLFGPAKASFKVKTCWILAQLLPHKPVNFASLTDSFITSFKIIETLILNANTKQNFRGRKVIGTFEKQAAGPNYTTYHYGYWEFIKLRSYFITFPFERKQDCRFLYSIWITQTDILIYLITALRTDVCLYRVWYPCFIFLFPRLALRARVALRAKYRVRPAWLIKRLSCRLCLHSPLFKTRFQIRSGQVTGNK